MNYRSTKYLLMIVVLTLLGLVYASRFVPRVRYPAVRFDNSLYLVTAKAVQALGLCLRNDPNCPLSPCVPTGDPRAVPPVARCTSEPSR